MTKLNLLVFFTLLGFVLNGYSFGKSDISKLKQKMIRASIASYSGSCACPYSRTKNGRSCGKRSAYSKPGGASPFCYESDITNKEVLSWKRKNK